MNETLAAYVAIAIMSSTNAKALSAGIISSIALLFGSGYFLPDTSYVYVVLGGYVISHTLSAFRS